MAADFDVISTQPYTYLDQSGSVVNGYKVTFSLKAVNEVHFIFTPNLIPDVVKAEIMKVVSQRNALSKL
jgi:hypothetical protein